MTFALLLFGLVLLLLGGTALVSGASSLATRRGVSPVVVGLTIVAFGTSAPELVVNILGATRGETELALGNVMGSNLANLGLVLGIAALMKPVAIQGQIVRRELPLLMLVTSILAVMTLDRVLQSTVPVFSRSDGIILLLLFSLFGYITIRDFLGVGKDALLDDVIEMEESLGGLAENRPLSDWLRILGGLAGLSIGGHLTIVHGSALAVAMGVSPVVVGLLVVAIGTSLPELITSIVAALRDESDLCLGNVIGSNIFNSLMVLPVSALVRPLPIPPLVTLDIFVSLCLAAVLVLIFLWGEARMGRVAGGVFVTLYLLYMAFRVLA